MALLCVGCSGSPSNGTDLASTVHQSLAEALALPVDAGYGAVFDPIHEAGPEALGICAAIALSEGEFRNRLIALDAIWLSDDHDTAVPLLLSSVASGDTPVSRFAYLKLEQILRDTGRMEIFDPVFTLASKDLARKGVSYSALGFIEEFGGIEALAVLRNHVETTDNPGTRMAAIEYVYRERGVAPLREWDVDWRQLEADTSKWLIGSRAELLHRIVDDVINGE